MALDPEVTVRPARHDDVPRLVALLAHGALVEGTEDPADPAPYGFAPSHEGYKRSLP